MGEGPATIIQTEEEARAFELASESEKVCVVAQTTFNYNKFKDLVEIISEKRYDIIVLNTICNATKERQEEAYDIAKRVDAMIVIGDKRSSNTQKLFEICSISPWIRLWEFQAKSNLCIVNIFYKNL